MWKKLLPCLILLLLTCGSRAQGDSHPVAVIFDTDMGPDYDDVGAITMLHALADSGKANILATMASNRYEGIAAVLNVFNTYFKRPDIPIGVPGGNAPNIKDKQHWTDSLLANYPHAIVHNTDAVNAVALYRKILAKQPDHSVVIITVGFLTNLADLLESTPDEASSLDGLQLAKKKVKLLVSMEGIYPRGKEFNVTTDVSAALAVSKDWPTPVIYSGFEIGKRIKCGLPLIHNAAIHNSPVKDVFRISIPQSPEDAQGRMSWDETAVLVGILGYNPWYSLRHGRIVIDTYGVNTWDDNVDEKNSHLVEGLPAATVQQFIDTMIMHQPQP